MFLNKFTITGIALIVIGVPLSVIWIGIPIIIIGFLIGDIGIVYGIVKTVPGLEDKFKKLFNMIKDSYKPYFRKGANQK